MLSQPPSSGTKVGAILYGLVAGISVVVVMTFVSFFLGALTSWILGATEWVNLGEYSAWLPLIFAEYSSPLWVAVGAMVCWKVWKPRVHRNE